MEKELIEKTTEATREKIKKQLLVDIEKAKSDMEIARINFDEVFKSDDVDICIYKLRDATSRYEKLLKELKELL